MRPRKFYATRHTFISLAMTKGMPLKLVATHALHRERGAALHGVGLHRSVIANVDRLARALKAEPWELLSPRCR